MERKRSKGLGSSSREKSNKKIKSSKDVSFDLQTPNVVQEVSKRPRTAVLQNQECSRRKKRKPNNWDGTYSVIIEWLNYYCVSDSDEDEVPLINKRTERRKRQKMIGMSLATEFSDSGNDTKYAIVPVPQLEERLLPNHGVAGDQAADEPVSSPLNSPIRGDIIDISDG